MIPLRPRPALRLLRALFPLVLLALAPRPLAAQPAPAPPPTATAPTAPAAPAAPPEGPAQPAAPPEPPAAVDTRLEAAKELFQKGNELRKAGDYQRALDFYLRSRQLVVSVPNTINAAFCLEHLGRYDEALELYEELLTDFRAEIGPEEQKSVTSAAAALRPKIGSVTVSSNVDGLVVIDGRMRGKLPLPGPIRLLPGAHTVRVVKDGWETFEKVFTVHIGETISVDAKLSLLTRSGRLRVEDERLVGADLFIDGTLVGQLPWEGTLAPGAHFYSVRRGDLGSAPREANVVAGQIAIATVEAGPLGPELRVVVQPLSADLTINGVPVGKGQWRGTLPLGRHTIEAHEPGYFARTIRPTVAKATAGDIPLRLDVDESHPRWGRKAGIFWLTAVGGYAFASSLGSAAEEYCDRGACDDRAGPSGALFGLRGGYEFPIGISIELLAGYVTIGTRFQRRFDTDFTDESTMQEVPIRYTIQDDIDFSGPVVAVGAGYRLGVTDWLDIGAAAGLGVVLAGVSNPVGGTVSGGGQTVAVEVENSDDTLRTAAPFVMPELRVGLRFGKVTIGAGMGVALFLIDGPPHETPSTRVVGADCAANPATAHCAPTKPVIFEERSHGTFAMFVPSLSAGYRF